MIIKGKTVLITGSTSGIGEATAYKFARSGAKIIINGRTNLTGAETVLQAIQELGGEAKIIMGDTSDEGFAKDIVEQTVKEYGSLDILINNAGVAGEPEFMNAKKADWIQVFNNNLFNTMLVSQVAAKEMHKNGKGKILNTASIRGLDTGGREGIMAYSLAKAAVISFTKTLAKLLSPNIQVNGISPGFVWTPNYESVPESTRKMFIEGTQLKRWIDVEEIANGFMFLAENDALNGEVINIDAGWILKQG